MKINEKNLGAFASSTTPVDREGWLDMRGEIGKSYQRRWFTLKGNLLFYFDKKADKDPVGVIILEGCTIVVNGLAHPVLYQGHIEDSCEAEVIMPFTLIVHAEALILVLFPIPPFLISKRWNKPLDLTDKRMYRKRKYSPSVHILVCFYEQQLLHCLGELRCPLAHFPTSYIKKYTKLTEEEAYSFKIVFQCEGGRTYYLCTNSQASMEAWMKALACASYDYMKLMVAELQRQLDEVQAEEAAEAAALITISPPEREPKVPPRGQRYNPFNRVPDGETKDGKSVPGSRHHKDSVRSDTPRKKVPFRDIHTAHGRKILAHRSEWRARRRHAPHAPQTPATPARDVPLIQL